MRIMMSSFCNRVRGSFASAFGAAGTSPQGALPAVRGSRASRGGARVDTCDFADGAPDDNLDGHLDSCSYALGDLDLSGEVDTGDLSILLLYIGDVGSPTGDLDADGVITTGDVSLLLMNFGPVFWP